MSRGPSSQIRGKNTRSRSRKNNTKDRQPAADDDRSFISGSDIDAQYLDFLNTANQMANDGDINLGIRLLEDELNERLEKYSSRDKGVWIYSKGIADLCNNRASQLINHNMLDNAIDLLKLAKKYTEPLPNSNWSDRNDWKLVRK